MIRRYLLWLAITGTVAFPAIARTIKITFILVPEQTACRPDGYEAGEENQNCVELTVGIVKKWTKEWPSMESQLKAGDNEITLKPEFSEKLHSLIRACWPPHKRWAVVLWMSGVDATSLSIHRAASQNDGCDANAYDRVTPVSDRGNAINHQRGDVFRPAMNAEWTLESSGKKYSFTLARARG